MPKHIITKSYQSLKGFSTDGDYVRPPHVSTRAFNVMKGPDGTFNPRRGYQGLVADIGGLGISTFENIDGDIEVVTIDANGLLYRLTENTVTCTYSGTKYVGLSIFVDTRVNPDSLGWGRDLWSIDPWGAITRTRISSWVYLRGAAVSNGAQAGVNTFNVDNPHQLVIGNVIQFLDQNSVMQQRTVTGTAAATVTFDGSASSIKDNVNIDLFIDQSFGVGYDEGTSYDIASYITLLNTIPNLAVVASSTSVGYPAAFLPFTELTNIIAGQPFTLKYYFWQAINRTVNTPFSGKVAQINSDDFENSTFANFDQTLYIATGYDEIHKYDGQTVYRAGMPQGGRPSLVKAVGGSLSAGDYFYTTTYEQVDHTGRIVEGEISEATKITVAANDLVTVTLNNLVSNSGWNTNCAVANGTQVGVNAITVTAGHTIKAGDTAFFVDEQAAQINGAQASVTTIVVDAGHSVQVDDIVYFLDSTAAPIRKIRTITAIGATSITFANQDAVSVADNVYIQVERTREVTVVGATSVTVAGTPVNIVNGSPISNNLKINIYRTKVGLTQPNLVFTVANNSFATTQAYVDLVSDTGLDRAYATPVRAPNPPPIAKYIKSYRNIMIYGGVNGSIDMIPFSEGDNPEYVPEATNFFLVPANDDSVSGLGVAGTTLVVFKDRSIYAVNGDLLNSQFTVLPISPGSGIGCAAHATIQSIGASLLYFLHTNGVYAMSESTLFPLDNVGNPVALSLPIDNLFRITPLDFEFQYQLKRAVGWNYSKDLQYMLFLPCENTLATMKVANQNSRIYCFDYQGKNWFEWDNINAAGGFYQLGDNLYWQERRFSGVVGNTSNTYRQLRNYRLIDYVDHTREQDVEWVSSWEDLGEPMIRKKFIRALLLIDRISDLRQFNQPILGFSSYIDRLAGRQDTKAVVSTVNNPSGWAKSAWGWGMWSGYEDNFIRVNLKQGTVAKSIAIGIKMRQYNASFRLQGFQLEVSPDFRKMIAR